MTGLAAFKRWMFCAFGAVTAIAGAICVPRMISHKGAHGVALAAAFQGMAFFPGAFDKSLTFLIRYMMARSAFYAFMRVVIENYSQSWACAVIKQNRLANGEEISSPCRLREYNNGYDSQNSHFFILYSEHIPERRFKRD